MNQTSTSVPPPLPVFGVLSTLEPESWTRRLVCLGLALLLATAFFCISYHFLVPTHPGVDQNGYLAGGRMIAEHGSMAYQPRRADNGVIDPMQFVGRMWVGFGLGTDNERYFPKYPVGLPLLYAGALKLGGPEHGVALAYLISPLATALALIAVFLLARHLLGSVPSLFVTLLVATSPVTVSLANNPNSHATSLLLVAWGMYLTVRWWFAGGIFTALLAGLLIGCAPSIRYTEGMLILPLAIVAFFRISQLGWRNRSAWLGAIALGIGWLVPVVALFAHNRIAMGAWTGYDPTNESTGFSYRYFAENWDTMLRLMYQTGMTLVFPMAVGGLAAGFVWNWRVATFLASWIVPCLLIYTAYYWAPEGLTIGYTRFFLTIFPALGICAFGLLLWPVSHLSDTHSAIRKRLKLGAVLALSAVTLLSIPLGIANVQQSLEADLLSRRNLKYRSDSVLAQVPAGSILVCEDTNLANHLQFAGDYILYTPEVFMRAALDRLSERNPDEPNGLDPGRARHLLKVLDGKTQQDIDALRDDLIISALQANRRVFVFSQTSNSAAAPVRVAAPNAGQGLRPPNAGNGANAFRRLPGWRGLNTNKVSLTPVFSGTDPVAMPRNNPLARWALGGVGRDRIPTTLPYATWQIHEVTLRAPATQPASMPSR